MFRSPFGYTFEKLSGCLTITTNSILIPPWRMHRQLSNSLGGIWALDNGTVYVADVGNHRVDPAVLLDDFDLLNQPYLLKIWAAHGGG